MTDEPTEEGRAEHGSGGRGTDAGMERGSQGPPAAREWRAGKEGGSLLLSCRVMGWWAKRKGDEETGEDADPLQSTTPTRTNEQCRVPGRSISGSFVWSGPAPSDLFRRATETAGPTWQ